MPLLKVNSGEKTITRMFIVAMYWGHCAFYKVILSHKFIIHLFVDLMGQSLKHKYKWTFWKVSLDSDILFVWELGSGELYCFIHAYKMLPMLIA